MVQGNRQLGEWDAQDVYSAIAHMTTIRLFFAWVAAHDLECECVDFDTAFLNAMVPADTTVYIE